MAENLLPTGSVISLKGAEKRLTIIGISARDQETSEVYDYIAVPYPEGFISSDLMFLFNHADIETVHFLGFVDAEYQTFKAQLSEKLRGQENK
jgi:hypothetical protein